MRLHRFFIAETIGGKAEISVSSAELAHQMSHVFRLGKGDHIILFDGSGSDSECEILEIGKETLKFRVVSSEASRYMPSRKVYLYAAIVKKGNFEFIVEKATELGVTDIIPVMAERSEKKSLNEERLTKIAVEASEQSGRGSVPKIHGITSLGDSINHAKKETDTQEAFHTEGEPFDSAVVSKTGAVAIFIGPEGGWSPSELELFHAQCIDVACLGAQVLRAETAVIAALSVVVF
ncbi:MAG: hypothetical protein JWO00_554 [Candidatus Parcubacteria bacterium]|nr:hypothetical protein [Candidatus Parcubacteria bacterium]